MNELEINESIFESIKHTDEDGNEFWYARELMEVLGYKKWQKFKLLIEKAIKACEGSKNNILDHFTQLGKMVDIGSNTKREITDYKLSRYACYLIVMNGDSKKEVIALGQTYFAVKTRKMEVLEREYESLSEDEKRFYQRSLTKKHNQSLNQTASKAGVRDFGKFHNAGYRGLYNGETADDIAKRKGLRYNEDILDNMGSEELIDNLFRITHTNTKIKNDNVNGENNAIKVHFEVGKKVRKAIADIGGTMPENLPTPEKSLKELEKYNKDDKVIK